MDLSWPALEGMTWAVIASCQTALNNTDDSLGILHAMSLRDLPAAIRASVFWRRAIVRKDSDMWKRRRWILWPELGLLAPSAVVWLYKYRKFHEGVSIGRRCDGHTLSFNAPGRVWL